MFEVLDLYHHYGQLYFSYTGSFLYGSTPDLPLDLGVWHKHP